MKNTIKRNTRAGNILESIAKLQRESLNTQVRIHNSKPHKVRYHKLAEHRLTEGRANRLNRDLPINTLNEMSYSSVLCNNFLSALKSDPKLEKGKCKLIGYEYNKKLNSNDSDDLAELCVDELVPRVKKVLSKYGKFMICFGNVNELNDFVEALSNANELADDNDDEESELYKGWRGKIRTAVKKLTDLDKKYSISLYDIGKYAYNKIKNGGFLDDVKDLFNPHTSSSKSKSPLEICLDSDAKAYLRASNVKYCGCLCINAPEAATIIENMVNSNSSDYELMSLD